MAKRATKTTISDTGPTAAVAERQSFVLPETLDLAAATGLAKSLLAQRGSELTMDASQVRHLGGQCAQILISAARTWQQDQIDLRIVEHSAEFDAAIRLLGLASALEIKESC